MLSGDVMVAYCPVVRATEVAAFVTAEPLKIVNVETVCRVIVTVPAAPAKAVKAKLLPQPDDPASGRVTAVALADV
jgi:hypothetical protein